MKSLAIASVDYLGSTDNNGDDALFRVELSEDDGPLERLLVSWPGTYGVPSREDVENRVAAMAGGFQRGTSMLKQFRASMVPHPEDHPTRRVLMLRPRSADET
jgi:hypothetical protein